MRLSFKDSCCCCSFVRLSKFKLYAYCVTVPVYGNGAIVIDVCLMFVVKNRPTAHILACICQVLYLFFSTCDTFRNENGLAQTICSQMLVLLHNLCTLWKWNRKQAKAENKVQTQRAWSSNYTTGKMERKYLSNCNKKRGTFFQRVQRPEISRFLCIHFDVDVIYSVYTFLWDRVSRCIVIRKTKLESRCRNTTIPIEDAARKAHIKQ